MGSRADELRTAIAGEELHAPTFLDHELVSAVRGRALGGIVTSNRARDLLTDFDDLPLQRWPAQDALRRRAFALRDDVSAYDTAYMALAESLDCPLLTRDTRLARANGHSARVLVL